MVVWWKLGSVLYRIMGRKKKTGQLKVLVSGRWALSMEISKTILRCGFPKYETTDKNICAHIKNS